ncbi:MAG: GNAT family N-acetyltransferase [Pseudorhodobacter sp. PARRP1]|nr:MAG: GNAT family N-acetyltransferase [Pseudorhodobacter sp. PARRP1]
MTAAILRPATPKDTPALLGFLAQHEAGSMFPMHNLLGHGPKTENWLFQTGPHITGYLGLTADHRLMPQAPDADWSLVRPWLAERAIAGLIGPPAQCKALQHALGLDEAPLRMQAVEPGFSLDLADLILPPADGFRLTPLSADLALVIQWRAAALVETMGFAPQDAPLIAHDQVHRWQAEGRHRILWQADQPVAIAGFNAQTAQAVQIGGVYTPPALRNHGHARRAVAMILAEARQQGCKRAVLFAASQAAARAYLAIGFRPSHSFALILFTQSQQVAA